MISYSYTSPSCPPHPPPSYTEAQSEGGVTVKVRFPSLASCHWCLKLYGLVVGGMGIIFSLLWVIVHAYVITQIVDDDDLKVQRYMDICMGLSLLVSLVSLEYGSMSGERGPLALFLILSLATIAGYWLWFLYLKYLKMESEASKEHEHVGLWVTGVYLVLVSPVLLLYRSLDPERVTREQLYMAAEDGAKERSAV